METTSSHDAEEWKVLMLLSVFRRVGFSGSSGRSAYLISLHQVPSFSGSLQAT
jgi:hypothetical protein